MPPVAVPPLIPPVDLAGLEPTDTIRRRWASLLGAGLTAAMVVALARELLGSGRAELERAVPANPFFYLAFALLYLSAPTGDLAIYRRLWRVPWLGGFVALNKKRIANDTVLGYSGEVYFYAWARANCRMVAAPSGRSRTCRSCRGSRATPRPCCSASRRCRSASG